MTRTKAMLWGAVFAGGIGPLLGGALLVAFDMLVSHSMRLSQTRVFVPLLCLIFCGIPGVILGLVSGHTLAKSPTWKRMLIGTGVAFATTIFGLFVLNGFPRLTKLPAVAKGIWIEAATEPALLMIVLIAGLVCGWLFPTRSPNP